MKTNKKANALLRSRQRSYYNQRRLKQEINENNYPQLKQLRQTLNSLGIRLMKESAAQNTVGIQSVRQEMELIDSQIHSFLKTHKIEPLPQYFCSICQDTGYVNDQICQCLSDCMIDTASLETDFKNKALEQRFENFDLTLYSEKALKDGGLSPRQNAKKIYESMSWYTENFSRIKTSLLFTGPPGIGKTFTSNCITNALMAKGYSIIYITAAHLISTIQDQLFRDSKSQFEVFRPFSLCDLLIIDDLGAEYLNDYGQKQLYEVIDGRLNNQQNMIISTNLSVEKIREIYDERLSSRITGNFNVYPFFGDDIRLLKKRGPRHNP
ncbi:ATP-binding protein [Eubacteriaceae bacterium ES2]|nr:ATP-binding protein [Eubacteriaceae bacterium ES2]